ncbi:MAG TPA: hypothetical protein VNL15_01445, partial [Dehalococcoidia bacterium]|nr:hypothetical protein [Dehalococcoidia bacterium]
ILNVAEKQREPIALFPEAIGHGKLIRPPAAVGAFLLLLSEHGLPMLPVGIYEDDGVLSARFGEPFFVDVRGIGKEKRAEAARDQVMVAIGRLLPPHLWGAYSAEVAQEIGPLPGERPHGGLP